MHTLEYASSRREIWRWYWRSWAKPRGLWLFHVLIAFLVTVTIALRSHGGFSTPKFLAVMVMVFAACVAIFPLWPQVAFKPAVRTLTADPTGIRTSIGMREGSVKWKDVADIQVRGTEICIAGRHGNAFVVPARAFGSESDREKFISDITSWHVLRDA
jgi:hypothetical protein